jgi:hypothetical protein
MRKASRTGPRDTPSAVGQRGLVQLGARRELARQDGALDLLLHHHGQRAGLQQGDGRVGSAAAHVFMRIGSANTQIVNNLQTTVDTPGRADAAGEDEAPR